MHQSSDAGSSDSVLVVTAERYSVNIDSNVHLQKRRLGINFLVIYFQVISMLIFSESNSNCKVKLSLFSLMCMKAINLYMSWPAKVPRSVLVRQPHA